MFYIFKLSSIRTINLYGFSSLSYFFKVIKTFYLNYCPILINNLFFRIFIIIFFYFFIFFIFNDHTVYCMENNPSSDEPPTIGIAINTNEAFKYIGMGGLATGVGIGTAKILRTVLANSRLKLVTMLAGISGATYTTSSIASELASNRQTRSSTRRIVRDIPDVEFDGTIKFEDFSIKTVVNKNEVILSELKRKNNLSENVIDNVSSSSTNASSSSNNDYYTITDSYNIPSILEKGDLINTLQYNPYLKLEFVLLFLLFLCLSSLFSLTIITILKNCGENLNNYFTNKYILMYINLNRRYLHYFIIIWFIVLYIAIILSMYITYLLIFYYEDYMIIQSDVVSTSLMFFNSCTYKNIDPIIYSSKNENNYFNNNLNNNFNKNLNNNEGLDS